MNAKNKVEDFFALIQKLNFIFADESFNEMNIFFSTFRRELETALAS